MGELRVILADDHPVFRMGLLHVLKKDPLFRIVGEAESRTDFLRLLASNECDLAIFDQKMPDAGDGMAALREIKTRYPKVKTVILSQYYVPAVVQEAFDLGLDGYLTKDDISETILPLLKAVAAGDKILSPRVQTSLLKKNVLGAESLTERELAVARLIGKGLSRKEIAADLDIALSTVDFHLQNAKQKLGAKSAVEILQALTERGYA